MVHAWCTELACKTEIQQNVGMFYMEGVDKLCMSGYGGWTDELEMAKLMDEWINRWGMDAVMDGYIWAFTDEWIDRWIDRWLNDGMD